MGRELEFKYALTGQDYEALKAQLAPFREIRMETTYFDTESRAFGSRKWTLRRRLENGTPVCTLKTAGEHGARGEWEAEGEDFRNLLRFPDLPEEFSTLLAQGVHPLCGAKFTRLARDVTRNESRLELALDKGEVLGGGKAAPILELEVELKAGRDEDARSYARELAQTHGLEIQKGSKFRRALALTVDTDVK